MDSIRFRYLPHLVVDKKLETSLMKVVIVYSYDGLDIDIYVKVFVGLVDFQILQRQSQCLRLVSHYMASNMLVGCGTNV
jgi:hypothetical protein